MRLAFIADVLRGVQSGAIATAQARPVFERLFGVMCWEFLDDRRRDALTEQADGILRRLAGRQIDHTGAQREISHLIEAAVKRDFHRFDSLCAASAEHGLTLMQ